MPRRFVNPGTAAGIAFLKMLPERDVMVRIRSTLGNRAMGRKMHHTTKQRE